MALAQTRVLISDGRMVFFDQVLRRDIKAIAIYTGICLAIALALTPISRELVSLWLTREAHGHGVAAFPACLLLLLARGAPSPNLQVSRLPLGLASLGTVALVGGILFDVRGFLHLSVPLLFVAAFALVFGRTSTHRHMAALALLFFMVPAGDFLLPVLQSTTLILVQGIAAFFGPPIAVNGLLITTDVATFRVNEACAGLKFMMAAMMLACFFWGLFLDRARHGLALVALAAGLAFLANGIRVFLMVYLATATNMKVATGVDHLLYGWVLYIVILFFVFAIGHAFSRKATLSQEG